jgi:hypothetical protein
MGTAMGRTPFFREPRQGPEGFDLNGRKFGDSFLQFSDATLKICPRGVTPFLRWSLRVDKAAHRLWQNSLELGAGSNKRQPREPTKIQFES